MEPTHEQDDISDLLRNLRGNGDGFRSPDAGHFEQLADRVLNHEPIVRTLPKATNSRRLWLGYAAAAVICLLAAVSFLRPDATLEDPLQQEGAMAATTSWESQIDALDASEISEYIDENIEDFDLDLLAEDLAYPEQ